MTRISIGLLILLLAACERPPTARPATPSAAAASTGTVNPAPAVRTYHCADGQTVEAGYPDPQTAVVTYKGHAYPLKIARSGSGARYTGFGLQWWTKGLDDAVLAPLALGEEVAAAAGLACSTRGFAEVAPPAPGTAGGLPDDRTPLSEAPFIATSAQGAADVVQSYFALLESGRTDEAARLRADGRPPDLSPYASYHAQVGAPGRIEGAAGSLYAETPVVIYGRLKSGAELHQSGRAVLRRANDVPGASAEQRRWKIERLELTP